MATGILERCANCERAIGRLETPHVWQEQIVCSDCYKRLSPTGPVLVDPSVADEDFVVDVLNDGKPATPSLEYYARGENDRARMMKGVAAASSTAPACPNCGSRSPRVRTRKGSIIVLIVLLCFGVLPGLLYAILNDGYVWKCSSCGAKTGDA